MGAKARAWSGRLLLRLAVAMERHVAGGEARSRMVARRNRLVVAACERGVDPEVAAERLDLSANWIKSKIRERKKAKARRGGTAA